MRAIADKMTKSIKRTTAMKEATTDPLILWQKLSNCWQMAIQFAFTFPLCAKYTIAAPDPDADVVKVIATYSIINPVSFSNLNSLYMHKDQNPLQLTASKVIRNRRGALASGRTMATMEIGNDSTR